MNHLISVFSEFASLEFIIIFTINLVSIFIFSYLLYYRNHKDYQGFVTYFLFNIFIFFIIYLLGNENINMTVGFAIFGLVGIVRLRSDTMSKTDIIYFLGSLTIAITNSLNSGNFLFLVLVNFLILFFTFVINNKTIQKKSYKKLEITLDEIPQTLFTDKNKTTELLSKQFDINVIDYEIKNINNIKDSVNLNIIWK